MTNTTHKRTKRGNKSQVTLQPIKMHSAGVAERRAFSMHFTFCCAENRESESLNYQRNKCWSSTWSRYNGNKVGDKRRVGNWKELHVRRLHRIKLRCQIQSEEYNQKPLYALHCNHVFYGHPLRRGVVNNQCSFISTSEHAPGNSGWAMASQHVYNTCI